MSLTPRLLWFASGTLALGAALAGPAAAAGFDMVWTVPVPPVVRAEGSAEANRNPAVSEGAFLPDGRVALQLRFTDGRRQWMIGSADTPPEPGPEQPRFSNYPILRTDHVDGLWGIGAANVRIVEGFPPYFRHQDIRVTRFDSTLAVIWESGLAGNEWRYPYSAATLFGTDLVVTGQFSAGEPRNFLARLSESGEWQWLRVFGIGTQAAVGTLTDGTILVSLVEEGADGAGDSAVWLFDAEGNAKARAILRAGVTQADPDELAAMAVLTDGRVAYVANEFSDEETFAPLQVAKLNGAGEVLWQTTLDERPRVRPCDTAGSLIRGPQLALGTEGLLVICGGDLYAIDPMTGAAQHEPLAFPDCEGDGGHFDIIFSPHFAEDRLALGLPNRMGDTETCAWLARLELD
ncbi:MAG: hypothetical protein IT535_02455 [Bauldia sp.]|nr:hypothetical protein [Bauldia sp.]